MIIKIPIKWLIVFIFIVGLGFGFWILKKTENNKNLNSSFSQNRNFENFSASQIKEIQVTARQFSFKPNPIRVKLGDMVRLKITSKDVVHGFSLPEFGISEILEPGKTKTIEFQAVRKGTFQFLCSVSCGSGHSGMRGTLIVE